MLRAGRPFALFLLALGASTAEAQSSAPSPTHTPAHPPAPRLEDIARWNDRTTPRKTLETFYFAITGYDRCPELISNAIGCLDLNTLDPEMRERDAALLANQLAYIMNRQDLPLYSVPDHPEGERVVLDDLEGVPIAMARQADGLWQFDAATVGQIGKMRKLSARGQREAEEARSRLAEGRTDPSTTMRSFVSAAMGRRDFTLASRCLNLSEIPPKFRAAEGAEMARKLAFVMQRCGFLFSQEVPTDPDGFRYVWHSNHHGRIMLERIRLPEGQDAWLFTRGTLRNLDALVEGFRNKPPDPRYTLLGAVINEDVLAAGKRARVPAPAEVPPELGTPRRALRSFFDSLDKLEFDADRSKSLLACLDLGGLPPEDRDGVGLRLASKLEAVLEELGIDLMTVPDTWEADPLILGHDSGWQVTLARGPDGAWRFNRETVASIPDLFERLTPAQKTARERRSNFHSAQQTMRTLLNAVNAGDLDLAAQCLDLDEIPVGARAELGPVLAYKLKFVLDRIGRVELEAIPPEPDGPRFHYHRGPLGRIDLARRREEPRLGEWQFSRETVERVEAMFRDAVDRPISASLSRNGGGPRSAVTPAPMLSLRLRSVLPAWLRSPTPGLELYQWIGLVVALTTSAAAAWLGLRLVGRLAYRFLIHCRAEIDQATASAKLRPLALQLGLWLFYLQLRLLDLPSAVVGVMIPAFKVTWIGLMGWTVFRLIDLAMILYARSERFHDRRSLSDMIVPTAANGLKLVAVVVAISGQVYLIGNRESLTQLLAGLGLVGLAASLAAQDTLKNFFGTLLLIGEHPFRIGDHVLIQGSEGTVESVGFRSTRLRTFDDSLLTIPNSVMAAALIDNRGSRSCRRYRITVSLAYDTPPERMVALRDALRAYAAEHPRIIQDRVEIHIVNLGTSSVELLVQAYFAVTTYNAELTCRDEFSREILNLAQRFDVKIALPTQTIHVAETDHAMPPSPKFLGRERLDSPKPTESRRNS